MCTATPMSRVAPKEQSELKLGYLKGVESIKSVSTLLDLVQSAFGPKGRIKFLHNNSGGHVTVTSTSSRMLNQLSVSEPVLKLVVAAVQGHLKVHTDGGLFALGLALKLIESSLKLEIHRHLLVDIYELLLKTSLQYLSSSGCKCTVSIDTTDISTMLTLIRSVMGSKPACALRVGELKYISNLILQTFLKTLDIDNNGRHFHGVVQYLNIEGRAVEESHIIDGVMFETPHVLVYRTKPLTLIIQEWGNQKGQIKVVLFNVSMSGDSSELLQADYQIASDMEPNDAVQQNILRIAEVLVSQGVGLVGCQKVISPLVKKYLQQHSVLVLDRLSARYIYAVHQLTGGNIMGTLARPPDEEDYGWLDAVTHKILHKKSYLQLQNCSKSVCTLILCNQSEEALEELKHACENSIQILKECVVNPQGLMGAGCWQTHLAGFIKEETKKMWETWISVLGCSKHQLITVANNLSSCLDAVAMSLEPDNQDHMADPIYRHHWLLLPEIYKVQNSQNGEIQCACGYIHVPRQEKEKLSFLTEGLLVQTHSPTDSEFTIGPCSVVDPYVSTVNAFRTAVGTAGMVLGIHNYIQDTN